MFWVSTRLEYDVVNLPLFIRVTGVDFPPSKTTLPTKRGPDPQPPETNTKTRISETPPKEHLLNLRHLIRLMRKHKPTFAILAVLFNNLIDSGYKARI